MKIFASPPDNVYKGINDFDETKIGNSIREMDISGSTDTKINRRVNMCFVDFMAVIDLWDEGVDIKKGELFFIQFFMYKFSDLEYMEDGVMNSPKWIFKTEQEADECMKKIEDTFTIKM